MRSLILPLALGLAAAVLTPALAGPNGAYAASPQRDARACARACANDGLCIAWAFHADNACALLANVPTSWPGEALSAGLSSRAPAFADLPDRPQSLLVALPHAHRDNPPEYALLGGPEDSALRPLSGFDQ
jgi:hypothetical protein